MRHLYVIEVTAKPGHDIPPFPAASSISILKDGSSPPRRISTIARASCGRRWSRLILIPVDSPVPDAKVAIYPYKRMFQLGLVDYDTQLGYSSVIEYAGARVAGARVLVHRYGHGGQFVLLAGSDEKRGCIRRDTLTSQNFGRAILSGRGNRASVLWKVMTNRRRVGLARPLAFGVACGDGPGALSGGWFGDLGGRQLRRENPYPEAASYQDAAAQRFATEPGARRALHHLPAKAFHDFGRIAHPAGAHGSHCDERHIFADPTGQQ